MNKFKLKQKLPISIRIWEVHSGDCKKILNGHTGPVYSIAKLSNKLALSCSQDTTIKLWNADSGECWRTFVGHLKSGCCVEVLSKREYSVALNI